MSKKHRKKLLLVAFSAVRYVRNDVHANQLYRIGQSLVSEYKDLKYKETKRALEKLETGT